METKYIHTAWAEVTIDKNLQKHQYDPGFYEWMKEELASKILRDLREKINYRTETEADGGVTYKAWLCWYDDQAAMEEAQKERKQSNGND